MGQEQLLSYLRWTAVVPGDYSPFPWDKPWEAYRFFTAIFLHRSYEHLVGNVLFLFIFGDNVEDRFGRPKFLVFFLFCGFLSFAFQVVFHLDAGNFNMGASGAIAAVLGAYFTLYPRVRIATMNPVLLPPIVYLPAFISIGSWFAFQFWMSVFSSGKSGIAWMAHVFGFLAGVIIRLVVIRGKGKRARGTAW